MHEDLYAILGLARDADAAEVRAAYRRLARAHHPDHAPGSEARMVAINLAYAVLSDPERRRRYDALQARPAPPEVPPPPSAPAPAEDEAPWSWAEQDLLEHADDWRQMYEEERHLWEQLLASHPQPGAARQQIEAALAQARQAQLELENALRAQAGLPPLSAAAFEAERTRALADIPRPSAGCLLTGVVCLLLAVRLAATRAVLSLATAWSSRRRC